MKQPKSLAMIKMEKNFIAHIEKNYPRQPYLIYSIPFLFKRLDDELKELKQALMRTDLAGAKLECADISNIIDFLFEKICNSP